MDGASVRFNWFYVAEIRKFRFNKEFFQKFSSIKLEIDCKLPKFNAKLNDFLKTFKKHLVVSKTLKILYKSRILSKK